MTAIEWTDATWNPVAGCSIVSPGCTNCYAMKQAARIERMDGGGGRYQGLTMPSKAGPVWTGKLSFAPDYALLKPLHWKKPRRVFVNSMSDLFHEDVPDAWIDRVFAVMALCPQHTFQVLTKRAARMREWARKNSTGGHILHVASIVAPDGRQPRSGAWPLPNVWLGVSAEDQTRADQRIPDLLATPAAVRFVSAEPLLGEIRFDRIKTIRRRVQAVHDWINALAGKEFCGHGEYEGMFEEYNRPRLDWIIVGGESGPNARPMHPDWARSIRHQCAAAGVPFFFKQWGEWAPAEAGGLDATKRDWAIQHGQRFIRLGKRRAGRLLDGVEHNGFPEA